MGLAFGRVSNKSVVLAQPAVLRISLLVTDPAVARFPILLASCPNCEYPGGFGHALCCYTPETTAIELVHYLAFLSFPVRRVVVHFEHPHTTDPLRIVYTIIKLKVRWGFPLQI